MNAIIVISMLDNIRSCIIGIEVMWYENAKCERIWWSDWKRKMMYTFVGSPPRLKVSTVTGHVNIPSDRALRALSTGVHEKIGMSRHRPVIRRKNTKSAFFQRKKRVSQN